MPGKNPLIGLKSKKVIKGIIIAVIILGVIYLAFTVTRKETPAEEETPPVEETTEGPTAEVVKETTENLFLK